MWQKLGKGSDIHQVRGYDPPQSVRDATALWAHDYVPKGGRPTERGHEVVVVEAEEGDPPMPIRVKPPPSPPSHRRWPRCPPPPLGVGALAATVATHVTDTCKTLVEQPAFTGVEAALARGRAADSRSAFARVEKEKGNTQRALDRALEVANKRGEELEAVRGDLKEANEGKSTHPSQKDSPQGAALGCHPS